MDAPLNPSSLLYAMFSSKEEEGFPTLSLGPNPNTVSSRSLDDAGSIISISTSAAVAAAGEGSGSNSSSLVALPTPKRARTDPGSSSGRFKGVVMQQNGHWGAQIYAHHSRIWLGTFKTDRAAAMAYDSAAIKLHRGDPHRNFPWTDLTADEQRFQDLFPTDAVLNMIKDGSYEARFADYLRFSRSSPRPPAAAAAVPGDVTAYRELFQKELTPSDVGKLNRLVIPKRCATKYLPSVSLDVVEELMLNFRDRENQPWVFRYCYWKSSQSYVFTKGWNKFVKEKRLKARDVVAFYDCKEIEGRRRNYRMIDIVRSGEDGGGGIEREAMEVMDDEGEEEVISAAAPVMVVVPEMMSQQEKKEVKLFGVRIN